MERFSQNLHSLSQVKYPASPKDDDHQHDAKVELRRLFNRLSIGDNDVESYYNIKGAVTPETFLAVNLQHDDKVDVDRRRDLWFALSEVTNAVRPQWNSLRRFGWRVYCLLLLLLHQFQCHSNLRGKALQTRFEGQLLPQKNVLDKVTSFTGHLQQSRGAYEGMSAIADVFFPLPTSILAPPAPVPNALVPVPQPPEPMELSERLHPQRLKIDMAVPVLKLLLLGPKKFGFTHPLVGIKDSSILALVLFRLSSTKSTWKRIAPTACSLASHRTTHGRS